MDALKYKSIDRIRAEVEIFRKRGTVLHIFASIMIIF